MTASVTKEECIRDLKRFYETEGRIPTSYDLRYNSRYISYETIRHRFGSWSNALRLADLKSVNRRPNMSNGELKIWLEEQAIKNENKCWIWTRGKNSNSYGTIFYHSKVVYVHRLVYQLWFEDPGQLLVCHTCDNPSCYNPEHLFLGTQLGNMQDKSKKGRAKGTVNQKKKRPQNLSADELFIWIKDEGTIRNEDGCWIFRSLMKSGYGFISVKEKTFYVHRWVYEYVNRQSIPMVGHKCNNKACCNPEHLYETNPRQNAIDTLDYHRGVKIRSNDIKYILEQASFMDFSIKGKKNNFAGQMAKEFSVTKDAIYYHLRNKVGDL